LILPGSMADEEDSLSVSSLRTTCDAEESMVDESEVASCAGAASDEEFISDDDAESLFPEAAEEPEEFTDDFHCAASAPSSSADLDGHPVLTAWRSRWQTFLHARFGQSLSFNEVPELLLELCRGVPTRFCEFFGELAGLDGPEPSSTLGPTAATGQARRRDILPLPSPSLSAEDMPQANSLTEGLAGRLRCRSGWLLLMVSCINYHYCLGRNADRIALHHGPPTQAQRAVHVRLAVAADALIDRSPEDVLFQDWAAELRDTKVSYTVVTRPRLSSWSPVCRRVSSRARWNSLTFWTERLARL
jgi:hypothetical protein